MLVTFHRYFRIVFFTRPEWGFSTVKKTIVGIVGSWAFNFTLLLLPLTKLWGSFGLEAGNQACRILKATSQLLDSFLVLTYTILPIVVQAVCYLHIYIKVRRQNRVLAPGNQPSVFIASGTGEGVSRTTASSAVPNDNPTNNLQVKGAQMNGDASSGSTSAKPAANSRLNPTTLTVPDNTPSTSGTTMGARGAAPTNSVNVSTSAGRRRKREIRLALLAFGFVAIYVVCFIPYSVTNTLNMLYHPVHEFTFGLVLAFLSINPMMYILAEERVRDILKRRFTCTCK
jgi:hypothetical protein